MKESGDFILTEKDQSYTNQQLFSMLDEFKADIKQEINGFKDGMSDLKEDMSSLKVEMAKTTTLIRDYNGLRSKIDECEKEISNLKISKSTEKETKKDSRDYASWIIAIIMFVFAISDKF